LLYLLARKGLVVALDHRLGQIALGGKVVTY